MTVCWVHKQYHIDVKFFLEIYLFFHNKKLLQGFSKKRDSSIYDSRFINRRHQLNTFEITCNLLTLLHQSSFLSLKIYIFILILVIRTQTTTCLLKYDLQDATCPIFHYISLTLMQVKSIKNWRSTTCTFLCKTH